MPKPPSRNNPKRGSLSRNDSCRGGKPSEIKNLLLRSALGNKAREFVERQDDWTAFFARHLDPALQAAIGHYVEKDGTLTVFVSSAVWAARLRFELPAHWEAARQFRPAVVRWAVKIQPVAASTGART